MNKNKENIRKYKKKKKKNPLTIERVLKRKREKKKGKR